MQPKAFGYIQEQTKPNKKTLFRQWLHPIENRCALDLLTYLYHKNPMDFMLSLDYTLDLQL